MKKTRTFARGITLFVTVLLLVATLSGCAFGGQQNTPTLTAQKPSVDSSANSMTAEQLEQIANMMVSVYSAKTFDPRDMLVAAKRGYDMTEVGFDLTAERPDLGTPNLAAAIKVIQMANDKASESKKLTFAYTGLNEADLNSLIGAFQTTVDLDAKGNLWDKILSAIGAGLNWLTNTLCFGSYLAGICLFAVIIEILMIPFAVKQQKNSIKQAMLRPKEMAIRNKYKGRTDQVTMQKMQQEIQEFYQRENYSPYSGCLQLVIQMPILIALYNIVIDPLHYVLGQANGLSAALSAYYSASKAAGGLGGALSGNGTIALLSDIRSNPGIIDGLKDFEFFTNGEALFDALNGIMAQIPNFNIGPINFGFTPSIGTFNILLLVPVLTFVTYFLTSKLTRKFTYRPATSGGVEDRQVACSNMMMDVTMPAMSAFFTFMVPALVGVYWMFRSLVGIGKQFIMSRVMPLPTFTEEDYKAAAKEMAGKRVVKKSENVGKVRSLHYIDDEDFEDTRERALARKAAIEEREQAEQKKKADASPFGATSVKDEPRAKKNEDASEDGSRDKN
ncbi:MAG: YidC/Oxa1 family membrane protein insertase [Clostridia bacterium]|nr:YidC/Oxa1 family membrane protein insertase [Clostridia bacterium]